MTDPTPDQIDKILERLQNDDQFRDQFLADPVGALGSMGVTIDPTQVSSSRTLASPDDIQKIRDALNASGDGTDSFVIFFLKG